MLRLQSVESNFFRDTTGYVTWQSDFQHLISGRIFQQAKHSNNSIIFVYQISPYWVYIWKLVISRFPYLFEKKHDVLSYKTIRICLHPTRLLKLDQPILFTKIRYSRYFIHAELWQARGELSLHWQSQTSLALIYVNNHGQTIMER